MHTIKLKPMVGLTVASLACNSRATASIEAKPVFVLGPTAILFAENLVKKTTGLIVHANR